MRFKVLVPMRVNIVLKIQLLTSHFYHHYQDIYIYIYIYIYPSVTKLTLELYTLLVKNVVVISSKGWSSYETTR